MPAAPTSPAREAIRGTVPKLAEISDTVIYGEVWERPGLSKRDRSLITVATLLALGREKQLDGHLARALQNGVTKEEIGELITHLAFYAGWPAAMTAVYFARKPAQFWPHWLLEVPASLPRSTGLASVIGCETDLSPKIPWRITADPGCVGCQYWHPPRVSSSQ